MRLQSLRSFVSRTTARRLAHAGLALATVASVAGCTAQQRTGDSPAYLVIDSLLAAPGAEPDKFTGFLSSDVLTNGGIYADNGQVLLRVAMKDPGSATNPTTPSSMNAITVTRYHVQFRRSDGRNVEGVDVPYSFDGGMTVTVTDTGATGVMVLVRAQAKAEAPLRGLVGLGGAGFISTLAEVTFYGTDQAGRAVTVTGTISVNFADWADPS